MVEGIGKVQIQGDTPTPEEEAAIVGGAPSLSSGTAPPIGGQPAGRASLTDVVVQGIGLGFADEIAGAAAVVADKALGLAGVRPSKPAADVFEQGRARKEQEIENVPASLRLPVEIAGGLLTGGLVGKGAVNLLGKVPGLAQAPALAKAAVVGGGEGAVAGVGFAQPGDRVTGAAIGAATGTVLGVAVPLTIKGITTAINRSTILRGMGKAARQSALRVLEALKSDDITLDQAQARLGRLGGEAIVADVGEENVKQIAQAVTGTAGKGRRQAGRVLGQRSKNAGRRVVQAIRNIVAGDDAGEVVDTLVKERSAAAKVFYDRAYAVGVVDDPVINQLIGRKIIKEGAGKKRLVGLERVVKSRGKKRVIQQGGSSPLVSAIKEAKRLDPSLKDLPDNHMILLDRAYKAIGGKANKARVSGDGPRSNALNDIRLRLRERLVELNPAYGDALDTFSGQSSMLDALELGRDVFKPKSNITTKTVAALTDSEREMFKVGLADALVNQVESGVITGNAAKRLMRTEKIQKQIRAAFGKDLGAFREYRAAVLRELEFAETSNIRFGSRTAPLQSETSRIAEPIAEAAADTVTGGSPVRAGLNLVRRVANRPGISPQANAALGQTLFSGDLGSLRAIEEASRRVSAAQGAAQPLIGGLNVGAADVSRRRR